MTQDAERAESFFNATVAPSADLIASAVSADGGALPDLIVFAIDESNAKGQRLLSLISGDGIRSLHRFFSEVESPQGRLVLRPLSRQADAAVLAAFKNVATSQIPDVGHYLAVMLAVGVTFTESRRPGRSGGEA